jgi:hypothetical protein
VPSYVCSFVAAPDFTESACPQAWTSMPGLRKKAAETHEPELYFRQQPKWCVGCMHRCLSYVNGYGLRELWCEDVMFLDWFILLLRSVSKCTAGVSDKRSIRSTGVFIIACRHSAVFLQCSSVLRLADPTDGGLPTCERNPSFRAIATHAVF